jgi:hypothetical protein
MISTIRKLLFSRTTQPSKLFYDYFDTMAANSWQLQNYNTNVLGNVTTSDMVWIMILISILVGSLLIYTRKETTNDYFEALLSFPTLTTLNANYMAAPRIYKKKRPFELDTEKMIACSTFKIKPQALIKLCQEVLGSEIGLNNESLLADDFLAHLNYPDIGPLNKTEYLEFMRENDLGELFSNESPGFCNYFVDPFNHNRVYFMSFWTGASTRMPEHHGAKDDVGNLPVTTHVTAPPQMSSLTFSDSGLVVLYTGAYVVDTTLGNCEGLGGKFGPLYAIGRSPYSIYKEGRPHARSIGFKVGEKFHTLKASAQKQMEEVLAPVLVKD